MLMFGRFLEHVITSGDHALSIPANLTEPSETMRQMFVAGFLIGWMTEQAIPLTSAQLSGSSHVVPKPSSALRSGRTISPLVDI
jgi:hypothetical protein